MRGNKQWSQDNPDRAVYMNRYDFFTCLRSHKTFKEDRYCPLCKTISKMPDYDSESDEQNEDDEDFPTVDRGWDDVAEIYGDEEE